MRTTIIPAQITTVEDKIAGSLNMTQILIMIVPILWTALVYAVFYPSTKIVPYKFVLVFVVTAICFILVLRIKDKIIAEWLGVLTKYRMRPKYYLFNKNTLVNRTLDMPDIPFEINLAKKHTVKPVPAKTNEIKLSDLVRLAHLVDSGRIALRYQFKKRLV
ncbi:PrgI family protein [Candidatus Collierbacteria bacterium]|nr:PrgI family protein [Candidatus Collierbacteria bacterium]